MSLADRRHTETGKMQKFSEITIFGNSRDFLENMEILMAASGSCILIDPFFHFFLQCYQCVPFGFDQYIVYKSIIKNAH